MPYLCALFDAAVDASMRHTINRIAAHSSFVPEGELHVPILGGLHVYPAETVRAVGCRVPKIQGRFIKWEVADGGTLQAVVRFDGIEDLQAHLTDALPRGRPWQQHHVALGSMAAIETVRHAEFLQAVEAAFPIDETVTFETTPGLVFHNVPPSPPQCVTDSMDQKTKGKAQAITHERVAAKSHGADRVVAIRQKSKKKRKTRRRPTSCASTHMKWERRDAGAMRGSAIDELIKTSGTRSRSAHAADISAASRAATIQKARQ